MSTQQLARGIAEIDTTARALRDQAQQLENLVSKFIIKEAGVADVQVPRKFASSGTASRTRS